MVAVSVALITPLLWANISVLYTFFVMQNYLTDVWGLSFTHAAAVLNFWGGIHMLFPGFCLYIADQWSGNYLMLVLSNIIFLVGTMLVAMSTPPVLAKYTGTCKEYESDCIGSIHRALFYAGMVLIAVGMCGNKSSVRPFLDKHMNGVGEDENEETEIKLSPSLKLRIVILVIVALIGAIALPYLKPWQIHFAIPAVSNAIGMFIFLCGSGTYDKHRYLTESPVTTVFRVFVVSASNMCKEIPEGDQNLENFGHTRCLRFLEKAAIIDSDPDDPVRNKWKVCTVEEVEEAKIAVRMIPMWMTFIICGIVSAIGNTYFVEQANNMNRKVGKWNFPLQILLLFYHGAYICLRELARLILYVKTSALAKIKLRMVKMPVFCIGLAMIFAILCCMTAAKIEERRLGVIRHHDLLEKPDEDIPMKVYWLFFQFFLLAGMDAFLEISVNAYYRHQAPDSMKDYMIHFTSGVYGLGSMFSVLSVYVVGRISERGGRTNWFQFTLNKSRLDKYYWVLTGMSGVNFLVFIVVALFYRYKENVEGEDGEGSEEQQETGDGVKDGEGFEKQQETGEEVKDCEGSEEYQETGEGVMDGEGFEEQQETGEEVKDSEGSEEYQEMGEGVKDGEGLMEQQETGEEVKDGEGSEEYQETGERVKDGEGFEEYQEMREGVKDGEGLLEQQETGEEVKDGEGSEEYQETGEGVKDGEGFEEQQETGEKVKDSEGSEEYQEMGEGVKDGEGLLEQQETGEEVKDGEGSEEYQETGEGVKDGEGSEEYQETGEGVQDGEGFEEQQEMCEGVNGEGSEEYQKTDEEVKDGEGFEEQQEKGKEVKDGEGSEEYQETDEGVKDGEGSEEQQETGKDGEGFEERQETGEQVKDAEGFEE